MNELSTNILMIMESSSLGRMSVYIISKQTTDLNINFDNISQDEAIVLAGRLKTVLPFFLADETNDLIMNIRKLVRNGNMVIT